MKSIILILLVSIAFSLQVSGQQLTVSGPKEKVEVYQEFTIKFSFDEIADSLGDSNFEHFQIIEGPRTSTSMNIVNGKKSGSHSCEYTLSPKTPGTYELESPAFYYKGKSYTEKFTVNVKESSLSQEEIKKIKSDSFKSKKTKPDGTYDITFNEELGYISIWKDCKLKESKDLTPAQISALKKLLDSWK